MPYTVSGAFDRFRAEVVDLGPEVTRVGRTSRDYLVEQLKTVAAADRAFPTLAGGYLSFGSFARRTKIRPLDDIDLLLLLNGRGTTEVAVSGPNTCRLQVTGSSAPLAAYSDAPGFFSSTKYVNSTRVLNAIKTGLTAVPNYRKAGIKRTGVAVTLNLSSREWVFDIVPALPVTDGQGRTTHYLMPDGTGQWMRTDPRTDSTNTTTVNTRHSGIFLPTLRLLKYWNRRTTKPRLASYYFETVVLQTFASVPTNSDYPAAVKDFFDKGQTWLWETCPDPKGLGPALDASVDNVTKRKVAEAMKEAATWAGYALLYAQQSKPAEAISWWGRVFGSQFPTYGA